LRHLAGDGVVAGVHYPVPVHLQPAYRGRIRTGTLPNTEAVARQVVSLPIYPELTAAQQDTVLSSMRGFFEAGA
jgi:dTDP-4-amino-4,6-dideoxygalactose transaminase